MNSQQTTAFNTQGKEEKIVLKDSELFAQMLISHRASLMAQMVKNLAAMRKTWAGSLGWEDPLEKGMVTHSSILAWRIPWTEEPGRLQSTGSQRVGHTERLSLQFISFKKLPKEKGNH